MAGFVTVADIKRLDDGQHADKASKGLYLQFRTSERTSETTGSWLFRYKPRGVGAKTSRMVGLGQFDTGNAETSLETARRRAADMRDLIAKGLDPAEQRTKEREAVAEQVKLSERPTFLQYATAYVKAVESGWKSPVHRQQWYNTLGISGGGKRRMRHCDAIHGTKIDKIDIAAVRKVLEPIWTTRVETARRLRGRLEVILEAARVEGLHPGPNPASWATVKALGFQPKGKLHEVQHHAALDWRAAPEFMVRLRAKKGIAARCIELIVLTVPRSKEARLMCWSEIDWANKRWTIPGGRKGRMKKAKPHAAPLAPAAIELLKGMQKYRLPESDFVFPGGKNGAAISDTSLRNILRDLGLGKDDASVHGFRSCFRTWASEVTNYPREAAEHALAHSLPALDAAYIRGSLFAKRVAMMADWATFCGSTVKATPKTAKRSRRHRQVGAERDAA